MTYIWNQIYGQLPWVFKFTSIPEHEYKLSWMNIISIVGLIIMKDILYQSKYQLTLPERQDLI